MNNAQPPITLDEIKYFRDELNNLFPDDPTKKVNVYSKEVKQFYEIINSKRIGIPKRTNPKEIGIILEKWYEWYSNTTPAPEYVSNTTLTGKDLEEKMRQAEIRNQQIKESRDNQKQTVEDFIKQNQEQIAKAQSVQDKLKDKIVYAEVVIPEIPKLTDIEQQDLETLKKYAKDETPPKNGGLTPKQILINDLTTKIEEILGPDLKNLPEEDKKIVAQTYAVKIVDEIAKPVVDYSIPIQTAILAAIPKDIDSKKSIIQKTVPEDPLLKQAKEGSITMEIEARNQFYTPKEIAKRLLGPLSTHIYGASPEEIQVTFVENKSDSQATHMVDLGELNQKYIQVLKEQDVFINKVKEIGFNKIQTVFAGEARTFLANKVIKSPVGILISKDPVINSIFTRYALSERVVWQTVGQSKFVGLVMKIAPDTAGPLLGLAGKALGKEFVKPIVSLATKEVAGQIAGKVATDVGVKAATGTGLAATITAAFAWTGPLAPVIGAIGAFIGTSIIGEGISNLFSKLKVWWTNNKDVAGPAVAIGLGFGGLVLGGPAVGGLVLLGGLAATGSLATFATGAFGVLGFIGRSVGIAIATPVIITLLVIPPLVAFIMLVINNSAYVVPPGPLYDVSGNPGGGGIHFECTDEKGPVGIDGPNSSSPIANRAWEITYDLYQGFWCFWNRSPVAPTKYFPNDILKYPDGYPNLFDYEAFLNNPNNTPSSGNLFWCTYLVVKSYQDSGVDIPFELVSQTLFDKWPREKILPNEATPNNVVPGSVIFFQVHGPGHPTRLNHVGIVYSVDQGGIVFVESNAGVKSQSAAFVSGKISRNIGNMEIKGFGLPN